jgi:hypothetical protein
VELTDDLIALLDEEANERGISESALIREGLKEHLADRRAADVSRRIVEGYERIPPATPDAWGDLGAVTDQAAVDLLQRLNEEERRGGEQEALAKGGLPGVQAAARSVGTRTAGRPPTAPDVRLTLTRDAGVSVLNQVLAAPRSSRSQTSGFGVPLDRRMGVPEAPPSAGGFLSV